MFVRAVAGVDDTRAQSLGQKLRRAGGTVTQNNDVDMIRFQNFGGVFQSLPLAQARSGNRDIDHVGAQSKRRQLERGTRTRAGFDKEIHQRFSAQSGDFFDLAGADLLESIRRLQNKVDFVGR